MTMIVLVAWIVAVVFIAALLGFVVCGVLGVLYACVSKCAKLVGIDL